MAPPHQSQMDDGLLQLLVACALFPLPPGALLVVPTGIYKTTADGKELNTAYVYARGKWASPIMHLPGHTKVRPRGLGWRGSQGWVVRYGTWQCLHAQFLLVFNMTTPSGVVGIGSWLPLPFEGGDSKLASAGWQTSGFPARHAAHSGGALLPRAF